MDEPVGFGEFVATRSRALLRMAWLLTGDWAMAQDLVQTALAKTWPRWESIRRRDQPEVYVRRVVVNTYATWWRRRWRNEVPTAELPEPPDPADRYAQVDSHAALTAALRRLPRRQRAVLVLRFYEDFTETQTASLLGCSVGTVKSQTAKALAKLRTTPGLTGLVDEEVPR